MINIPQNIDRVKQRIVQASASYKRDESEITLMAVSKRHTITSIRAAYDCGLREFGENYLQEALEKISALKGLGIGWHFIGSVQSNKTRAIAENFHWVHTVDRLKIAARLSQQRPDHLAPLNICLQVNIDREKSKSGADQEDIIALAQDIEDLPRLQLRGLMCIPSKIAKISEGEAFGRVKQLFDQTADAIKPANWDTLSMGMSSDLEAAIANHANIVRIGTDIFGPRDS